MFRSFRPGNSIVVLAALVALTGCGSATEEVPGEEKLGNDSVRRITISAQTAGDQSVIDAVPAPDGSLFYFSVAGSSQGIFRTTDDPKRPVQIPAGAGFTSLRGISVASDGGRLFATDAGSVVSLPAGGGQPAPVVGTEGAEPQSLEISSQDGSDILYFTGKDPSDGAPAVFKLPAAGGERTVVLKGDPLVKPDGVAVSRDGDVYVSDHGEDDGEGIVYRITDGQAEELADGITLGNPAGVALTRGDSILLVSSLNGEAGTAQVLLIDLESGRTGVVDKVIGDNRSAGGLHRAAFAAVMGWADVQRPGRVYRVDP